MGPMMMGGGGRRKVSRSPEGRESAVAVGHPCLPVSHIIDLTSR